MRVLFLPLMGPLPSAPAFYSTIKWVWPEGPALNSLKPEGKGFSHYRLEDQTLSSRHLCLSSSNAIVSLVTLVLQRIALKGPLLHCVLGVLIMLRVWANRLIIWPSWYSVSHLAYVLLVFLVLFGLCSSGSTGAASGSPLRAIPGSPTSGSSSPGPPWAASPGPPWATSAGPSGAMSMGCTGGSFYGCPFLGYLLL